MGFSISRCTGVFVFGCQLLIAMPSSAQKIYYPKNQEFGAPLSDEDWKALNPKFVPSQEEIKPASTSSVIPARKINKEMVRKEKKLPHIPLPPADQFSPYAIERAPAGLIDGSDGVRTLNRYSSIKIAPLFFYSTLDAISIGSGGTTAFVSNFNYGLEGEWRHTFANSVSTHLCRSTKSTFLKSEALSISISSRFTRLSWVFLERAFF